MKSITIITPVFNEEASIKCFYDNLVNIISENNLLKYQFSLLFSNNRSSDKTLEIIEELHRNSQAIPVEFITLSRNFGYQGSLTASLSVTSSDAYIIIDVDMEDPLYMIPKFIEKWEAGYDFVYGIRDKRPENFFIRGMRKFFYRFTNFIADVDFIIDVAEFSLISNRFKIEALKTRSTFPFLRTDFAYIGFNRIGIKYSREVRRFGETHYNFFGMAKFAIAGILSSSTFPLRMLSYIGVPLAFLELVFFFVFLFTQNPFYLSINQIIFFFYIFISIPSISIYIARIYKDGIRKPTYIIDYQKSSIKIPESASN